MLLYLYLMKWVGDSDMKINGIGLTKINYNDEIITKSKTSFIYR